MVKKRILHRRLIQFFSLLIYNADARHWFSGTISASPGKLTCVPGLNCYSCPGAVSSCPLGALQNTLATGRLPVFITGILLLFGTLFGRMVCSFLCPFGLVQELLFKIPLPKIRRTPHIRAVTQRLSLLKYLILALCIALPVVFFVQNGIGEPFFCKFFCPAGTVFAGWPLVALNDTLRSALGILFSWKSAVALAFILWSVLMFRPFCRFFCPLGAVYSFFNRTAVLGIRVDAAKCTGCNACINRCKMDVRRINDRECIRCGECASACSAGAIRFCGIRPQSSLSSDSKSSL